MSPEDDIALRMPRGPVTRRRGRIRRCTSCPLPGEVAALREAADLLNALLTGQDVEVRGQMMRLFCIRHSIRPPITVEEDEP